jgi:hypothetical protein
MRAKIRAAIYLIVGVAAVLPAMAQDNTRTKAVTDAFEHYEAVRAALSADKLENVPAHAKELVVRAEAVGGAEAKKAADQLAGAKTIEDARTHFGTLSAILVPIFQGEKISGTTAYICPMNQKRWIQRGDSAENPYYGKAMLTCAAALPPAKK